MPPTPPRVAAASPALPGRSPARRPLAGSASFSRPSPLRGLSRWLAPWLVALAALGPATGCGRGADSPRDGVTELRSRGQDSSDPAVVAEWLLGELLSPGGDAEQAQKARARLDRLKGEGLLAHFARALDDAAHGRPDRAADEFMRTVLAARTSKDERAPLIAWFAAQQAFDHRDASPGFGERWASAFEDVLARPGNIGWRAYGAVVDLWSSHAWSTARADLNDEIAKRLGCLGAVRLAGPFGDDNPADIDRNFPPEAPGPWPMRWEPRPGAAEAPRVLRTEQIGCDASVDEPFHSGVVYAESYVELERPERVLLTVSGAWRIWVDDHLVLDRDIRNWGVWPRYGVALDLDAGRHRILAKMGTSNTAIRVLASDGRPLPIKSDVHASAGYQLAAPRRAPDPNLLMRYIKDGDVVDPGDDLTRFVAAFLANLEGEADVASVLMEPLVREPDQATGLALAMSARFVEGDPIFDYSQTRDLMHELQVRAVERDPRLWQARLSLVSWEAGQKGPAAVVGDLEKLVEEFPRVPPLRYSLVRTYNQLGWKPELRRVVRALVADYPDSEEALRVGIDLFEGEGDDAKAQALLKKLVDKYPDTEVPLTRALNRRDYETALKELRRLAARRPDRKDLAERIYDVMVRAGNDDDAWKKLEAAIAKEPRDVHSRLALADARIANGEKDALAKTLADAVQSGADASLIEEAVDLLDGMTALEPYRLDARQVIREYEARGQHLEGTAARVLDYGAVWVRADGSSRMLEHEVIRIQSEEAISQFAEMERMSGLVLHQRVIKKDGRILEPEFLAEKPTVTMPHLEIGDYLETERIVTQWSDGSGARWPGLAWFFREENIAYARSEFVVISPANKPLQIDSTAGVPEPEVTADGPLVRRHWRVDFSPAAPVEPYAAPPAEFLPRVAVGWGASLEERLRITAGNLVDLTPVDPRIRRIAEGIVDGIPRGKVTQRAKTLYRWILQNVEEGEESDGRRVVVSRNGNRWRGFMTLCAALGIRAEYALAESRLSSPPVGPLSEANRELVPVLRLHTERDPVWLTVGDRYAPFGYVPSHVRGQKAYLLVGDTPELAQVPAHGAEDGVRYDGKGELAADGSAKLDLRLRFYGSMGAALRNGLAQIPENQLANIIESRLLGPSLQGARLIKHSVEDVDELERPLTLRVQVAVPHLATRVGSQGLVLNVPFAPSIGRYASLARRTTPLLFTEGLVQSLQLELKLPPGARVENLGPALNPTFGDLEVQVKDEIRGDTLTLSRSLRFEAGRVQPEKYPEFQRFAQQADDALSSAIRIRQ